MCRLLGVVSRDRISLDQAVAGELEPFTAQSEVHGDGWGVAWFEADEAEGERPRPGGRRPDDPTPSDPTPSGPATGGAAADRTAADNGAADGPSADDGAADGAMLDLGNPRRPQIRRHLDPARESAAYREAVRAATGPLMLIHLRKASPGSPLRLVNTHPFREGETVFAHNGEFEVPPELREAVLARGGRAPEGTTDSELFLSLIELHARETEPATAVQRAAAEITALTLEHGTRVPEALNCLYMTPDLLVAYQQSDPAQARPHHTPDNYSLRYRIDADRVIVASTGIEQTGYEEVGEGQALVVDRNDLSVSLRPRLAELAA